MTTTVTMLDNRVGEDGTVWQTGTEYSATDGFARWLVDRQFATATFLEPQDGWDDLRFPAQAINPAGAVAAPTVDTTLSGFPGSLLFAGNAENVIAGIAQMPHSWLRASSVIPHIHWSKPTGSADEVQWTFYYRHLGGPGDAPDDWSDAVAGTLAVGDQTSSDEQLITTFGSIAMTGRKESTVLAWRVHRLGDADAEANAVRLLEFDIHFISNKKGTRFAIPE